MSSASGSDVDSTKSRLIRELSRGNNHPRQSSGARQSPEPRTANTTLSSSFDPDSSFGSRKNDFDTNKIPELRDSAKKYKIPRMPLPEPDVATSQLGTAFPDFTQGLRPAEDSMSIEQARGYNGQNGAEDHDFSSSRFNGSNGGSEAIPARKSSRPQHPQRSPTVVQKLKGPGETRLSVEFSDMPNMSELVSGVFENGAPLFSRLTRNAKERPRFQHAAVSNVPVPDEEQEILMSLKLLQGKVAQLEVRKAEDAAAIETLRNQNEALTREKLQLSRSRRSDSAYGSSGSDGGDEHNIGVRRNKIEKLRLETNVRDLQEQLDQANERFNSAATSIKEISQERDTAINQLGIGYIEVQTLKKHVNTLSIKNEELSAQVADLAEQLAAAQSRTPNVPQNDADQNSTPPPDPASSRATVIEQSRNESAAINDHPGEEDAVRIDSEPRPVGDITCLSDRSLDLFPEIREMLEQSRRRKQSDKQRATCPTPMQAAEDHTGKSNASTDFQPLSEVSLLEQRSRLQGITKEDLTSAFILPDVTLSHMGAAQPPAEALTSREVEQLVDHDLGKCSICQRLLAPDTAHSHRKNTKTIPKPVPASERMPSPSPSNEDPTMRPSQSPGIALARVIKDLEDECKHLKISLKKLEDLSHQHVPALSKTKRARIEAKIAQFRHEISSKSDQIYALYDVLEGQKQAGQEMSQLEIEITLQDIGIDASRLGLSNDTGKANLQSDNEDNATTTSHVNRSAPVRNVTEGAPLKSALKRSSSKHAWDNLSDGNSLPWEGFESTADDDHTASTRRSRF